MLNVGNFFKIMETPALETLVYQNKNFFLVIDDKVRYCNNNQDCFTTQAVSSNITYRTYKYILLLLSLLYGIHNNYCIRNISTRIVYLYTKLQKRM